jgi:hypothetical protein
LNTKSGTQSRTGEGSADAARPNTLSADPMSFGLDRGQRNHRSELFAPSERLEKRLGGEQSEVERTYAPRSEARKFDPIAAMSSQESANNWSLIDHLARLIEAWTPTERRHLRRTANPSRPGGDGQADRRLVVAQLGAWALGGDRTRSTAGDHSSGAGPTPAIARYRGVGCAFARRSAPRRFPPHAANL